VGVTEVVGEGGILHIRVWFTDFVWPEKIAFNKWGLDPLEWELHRYELVLKICTLSAHISGLFECF